MAIFIPSVVANITLSFDETLTLLNGQPLIQSVSSLVKVGSGTSMNSAAAADFKAASKGSLGNSFVLNRVPKAASIEFPGYRTAATFNLSFDFRDIPIDPRTIRAAAVDIHMGSVPEDKFAIGMTTTGNSRLTKPSILNTANFFGIPQTQSSMMRGFVDEWNVHHTEKGSEIQITGRDMRAPLIDTPLSNDPKISEQILALIDFGQPIHKVVKEILGFHPLYRGIEIIVNVGEWPNFKIPSPAGFGVVQRHRQGAKGKKKAGKLGMEGNAASVSFWGLIVRLCYLVGAIPIIEGVSIYIRPVRRLYDQMNAGANPTISTPFAGGRTRVVDAQSGKDIDPISIRRMIYGRDIQSISFSRKFGGFQRPRMVRMIGGDDTPGVRGKDALIFAEWPPTDKKEAKKTKGTPSGDKQQEEVIEIAVPGIRDKSRLVEMAKAAYEEIGRGEIGGSVSTKNIASFAGDNDDPDLLRLKPGDAIDLQLDTRALGSISPLIAEFVTHGRDPFDKRVQQIAQRIGDEQLARVVVATFRGEVQELISFFRVANVRYTWNTASGIAVDFDFQNYLGRFQADPDQHSPITSIQRETA